MKPVEDGWNRGKNERTGQSGMYPTNYCEVYSKLRLFIPRKLMTYVYHLYIHCPISLSVFLEGCKL